VIEQFRRAGLAISEAAALFVLSGASVAFASVTTPTGGPRPGLTMQQARQGRSATPTPAVPGTTGDPSTPPARQTGDTPPAAASSASGSIIDVEYFQTCISCTTGHAGTYRPDGSASAIRIAGHEIAGGDGVSNASQRGALLALPGNPFLSLAMAGWRTTCGVDAERSTSFSHSRAALVDLALLGDTTANSLLTVSLLESTSDATYTGAVSRGDAVDNGVHVTALNGALALVLLHSEASSDHPRSSYIMSMNGDRLLAASQAGNDEDGTPTTIPGVLAITLLQVSGHGGAGG
jgi:hypothetical protein